MFLDIFENVRKKSPLVHCITNYVAANDCANIVLACGASPIMADDENEAEEITSICSGLNINMGTFSSARFSSMIKAGKKANELNHPIVLDPVGVGASTFRRQKALELIKKLKISVIRGNISEIKALSGDFSGSRGVDADDSDEMTLEKTAKLAKDFSQKTGAVIVITGKKDVAAYGERVCYVSNGSGLMKSVTGSGCQLSSLMTAFVSANRDKIFEASVCALCVMGLCGEIAEKRMSPYDGNASYGDYIIDAVFNLTFEEFERGAKYEMQ